MITRYKQHVDDILFSQSLNLYPAENQAAKIFVKWLSEHPEYSADDVDMRIDSYSSDRFISTFKSFLYASSPPTQGSEFVCTKAIVLVS